MPETFLNKAQLTGLTADARRTEILRAKGLAGLDSRVEALESAGSQQTTAAGYIATAETLAYTSTSYTDLATVGPSVTLTTGATALVRLTSLVDNASGFSATCYVSVAVSGATTLAASDAKGVKYYEASPGNSDTLSGEILLTGLTPGSNTFTVKYRAVTGVGTWTWTNRTISVMAL